MKKMKKKKAEFVTKVPLWKRNQEKHTDQI